MISARKVCIDLQAEGMRIVTDVSFDLAQGHLLGVYGPNGSGKSTLLKALAGITPHLMSGEVWIASKNIVEEAGIKVSAFIRSKAVIYIGSDYHCPFDVTVHDLFDMALDCGGSTESMNFERMKRVIQELQVQDYLKRVIRTLSDGEKQWVMFARALIQSPKVLILDEAFSKLDLVRSLAAARILKKYANDPAVALTAIIASHDPDFISETCDEILLLQAGRVLKYGPRSDVMVSPELKSLYPGLDLHVVMSPNSGRERILY